MRIVTYNVNGLRQRVSQFGSLLKLLDSLDADIICFQETKLSRQELTTNVAIANGYESFFSCTRTSGKGRVGYSGVATFCRVKSPFSSNEVALPVAAEEGLTGLVGYPNTRKGEMPTRAVAEGLEEFGKDELIKLDSEGRCVITDHGHFVVFNIYGPRSPCDDMERAQFKITFFKILQKRCESLIQHGRRVFIVGDLNIAPAPIDSSRAGPDFENNECRRWFRSMLSECGGPFLDVFRAKHPDRREAYTCWPQNTGAEEFNFGSRIDHILSTGPCLHPEHNPQTRNFITCHVKECDILEKFKRWKPGETPRWKGGRTTKLDGSDHAPVCVCLSEVPDISGHNTPSLSTRYIPKLHGRQQTIVSVLIKRQEAEQAKADRASQSPSVENARMDASDLTTEECSSSGPVIKYDDSSGGYEQFNVSASNLTPAFAKKKARPNQLSQLSLRSFFKKNPSPDVSLSNRHSDEHTMNDGSNDQIEAELTTVSNGRNDQIEAELTTVSNQGEGGEANGCGGPGNMDRSTALLEWQRIQQLMQSSIPLCKGHGEPCVPRIVKKAGPNYGRRFYVCARAEGPESNPEADCNYFRWAGSKPRRR